MVVIKFYCGELYYAFAAQTKELATSAFQEQVDENYTSCEEIPEEKWDEKFITIYEDNDISKETWKESIREAICGKEPQMIFTNDDTFID